MKQTAHTLAIITISPLSAHGKLENKNFILYYLNKAIEEIPNFINALSLLSYINYLSGDGERALCAANTCLDYIQKHSYYVINDGNPSGCIGIVYAIKGHLAYLTGDYESAIEYVTKAIELSIEDASLYEIRAKAYKEKASNSTKINAKKYNALAEIDIKKVMELQKEYPNKNVFLCSPNEERLKDTLGE